MRLFEIIAEDRLEQQTRYHPTIPDHTLNRISWIDPTPEKFYVRWLAWLYSKGALNLDNADNIRETLRLFHRAKLKKLLKEPDILRYRDVDMVQQAIKELDFRGINKTKTKKTADTIRWTYSLQKHDTGRFVAHCHSNVGEDVDIRIEMGGCWLGWMPTGGSSGALARLRKIYGGTGLMKPVVQAIYQAVSQYIETEQPECITIQGSDEMRERLYRSWIDWKFPGYQTQIIRLGIGFVKDGHEFPEGVSSKHKANQKSGATSQ